MFSFVTSCYKQWSLFKETKKFKSYLDKKTVKNIFFIKMQFVKCLICSYEVLKFEQYIGLKTG